MPDRSRLCEFSSKPEHSHGACNVYSAISRDRLPMIRSPYFPLLNHQIVSMDLALICALRR
jgi:hypothetical protein